MSINNLLLFCHVMGTILLFVSWSMEYKYIRDLKKMNITEVMANSYRDSLKKLSRFSMVMMLITLGTGIWLMLKYGIHASWMLMAMVALLLIIVIGLTLARMASKQKFDDEKFYIYLASSIRIRLAIGTGIIALMVFKTITFFNSLLIVLISLIIGIIWLFRVLWYTPKIKAD